MKVIFFREFCSEALSPLPELLVLAELDPYPTMVYCRSTHRAPQGGGGGGCGRGAGGAPRRPAGGAAGGPPARRLCKPLCCLEAQPLRPRYFFGQ